MQVGLTGGQGYLPRGPKDPFWTHSAPCPSPGVHSGFFVALSWEVCLQLPVPKHLTGLMGPCEARRSLPGPPWASLPAPG